MYQNYEYRTCAFWKNGLTSLQTAQNQSHHKGESFNLENAEITMSNLGNDDQGNNQLDPLLE